MRRISEKAWNDPSEIPISNSEWYIKSKIYKKQPTISCVNRNVEISRQAIHKFIKQLSGKGLEEVSNVEHNKKEKSIRLTALGENCFEKNEALKTQLKNRTAETIGEDHLAALKDLLKQDWKI
ncbi:MarR family winged helix-turn-helix transcriptional regulator [Planococcus sp. CAU13]|uniref:MarR family winged helix-turn-helix transcriptional regulator n=1 Tax=Planococcus sp. CAU13 TaxID=1541197 RepID=UPI000A438CA8|nr:MarR family winged helix-turn-helix transcriptional regulator [Planococcus sp. CAU13]